MKISHFVTASLLLRPTAPPHDVHSLGSTSQPCLGRISSDSLSTPTSLPAPGQARPLLPQATAEVNVDKSVPHKSANIGNTFRDYWEHLKFYSQYDKNMQLLVDEANRGKHPHGYIFSLKKGGLNRLLHQPHQESNIHTTAIIKVIHPHRQAASIIHHSNGPKTMIVFESQPLGTYMSVKANEILSNMVNGRNDTKGLFLPLGIQRSPLTCGDHALIITKVIREYFQEFSKLHTNVLSGRDPWIIGNLSTLPPEILAKLLVYSESSEHLSKIAEEHKLGDVQRKSIYEERLQQLDRLGVNHASPLDVTRGLISTLFPGKGRQPAKQGVN